MNPLQWLGNLIKAEQLGLFNRPAKPKKAPAAWQAVPRSKVPGAQRRRKGTGWEYRYPKPGGGYSSTPPEEPKAKPAAPKPSGPVEVRRTQSGWVAVQGAKIVYRGSEAEVRSFAAGAAGEPSPAVAALRKPKKGSKEWVQWIREQTLKYRKKGFTVTQLRQTLKEEGADASQIRAALEYARDRMPKPEPQSAPRLTIAAKPVAERGKEIEVSEGRYKGKVAQLSAKTSHEDAKKRAEAMTPEPEPNEAGRIHRTPGRTPATALGPDGTWYAGNLTNIRLLIQAKPETKLVGKIYSSGTKPGWHGATAGWMADEELARVRGYFDQSKTKLPAPKKPLKTARALEKELAKHGFDVADGRGWKRGDYAAVTIYSVKGKDEREQQGRAEAAAEQLWGRGSVTVYVSRDPKPEPRKKGALKWPPESGIQERQGYGPNPWQGGKYEETQRLSTPEIAKRIREDLKEAVKLGYLPKQFKASVTTESFSMGSSLSLTVKDMPADFKMFERDPDPMRERYGHITDDLAMTPQAKELMDNLNAMVNQYRYQDNDPMTDYFSTNFYSHVEFDSDLRTFHQLLATDKGKANAFYAGVEVLNSKKPDVSIVGDALVGIQGSGLSKDYPHLERKVKELHEKLSVKKSEGAESEDALS